MRLSELGISGKGAAVRRRMVRASTTSIPVIGRTKGRKEEGLLRMAATRRRLAATSSAVTGDPSWKRAPSRSVNSQVVASMARQDAARPGMMRWLSSGVLMVSACR